MNSSTNINSEKAKMSLNVLKHSSGIVDSLRHALAIIEGKRAASIIDKSENMDCKEETKLLFDKDCQENADSSHQSNVAKVINYSQSKQSSQIYHSDCLETIGHTALCDKKENIYEIKKLVQEVQDIKDINDGDNLFSRLKSENYKVYGAEVVFKDEVLPKPQETTIYKVCCDDYIAPLCTCALPPIKNSYLKKSPLCQAKDTVGNKVVGCLNYVTLVEMHRPAPRIVFTFMCDVHIKRLTSHQCCPVCGLFCTEGDFLVCHSPGHINHFSHIRCAYLYSWGSLRRDDGQTYSQIIGKVLAERQSSTVDIEPPLVKDHSDGSQDSGSCPKGHDILNGTVSLDRSAVNCPHCWKVWNFVDLKVTVKMPQALQIEYLTPLPKRARMSRSTTKMELTQVTKKADPKRQSHLPVADDSSHAKDIVSGSPPTTAGPEDSCPLLAVENNFAHVPPMDKLIASLTPAVCSEGLYLENLLINIKRLITSPLGPADIQIKQRDLFQACIEGDVESVIKHLYKGTDPNRRYFDTDEATKENREGGSALHAACVSGNIIVIHLLVQAGADINAKNEHLCTPLMMAASNNYTKAIEYLLKAGAYILDQDEDGLTAFHIAAKFGNLQTCKLLLGTGKVKVNIQDNGGWTPIIWASENKTVDVISWLLQVGGDPRLTDNEDNTPLHWAAFSGSASACQVLLDVGCDIDHQNDRGDTPLLLASRGADLAIKNMVGEMPIESCRDPNSQAWITLRINQNLESWRDCNGLKKYKTIYNDLSKGRERHPIMCVNEIDGNVPDQGYLYVTEHIETTDLKIDRTLTSMTKCDCDLSCSTETCPCISESGQCWYDPEGRLVDGFNFRDAPVLFECNRGCRCWHNCVNRVVQNGITCRIQLFRTKSKGWGLRALQQIPKGTFVCEYVGELITDKEADERQDDSYLFDLEHKDGERGDTFCIDARYYGNISRFLNHLCYPNLAPVKVFIDHQDLRFPRICFFACRTIEAYEELGFDYGEMFWVIKYRIFTCQCDSPQCRYSQESIFQTLAEYQKKIQIFNEATDGRPEIESES